MSHRRLVLPHVTAVVTTVVTALGACTSQPPTSAEPAFDIRVAPLDLPGIAFACYDIAVFNGNSEPVWSRGLPTATYPTDTTTLCSNRFGNAAGGDISYVGPCDADLPEHTVTLVLDGLYDDDGSDIGRYMNPCPPSAPCNLSATCSENADTPVTFNLTIMRAANQGFFDVAVNFDNIFCSAKVDCSYDDEGLNPIELLFDPDTGERTQTAVIGFACTAGPGSDRDTTLFMSDIRIVCGEGERLFARGYAIDACLPDGSEFHGLTYALTSNTVTLRSAQWERDFATGHYPATPLTVTGLPAIYENAAIASIIADPNVAGIHALALLSKSQPFAAGISSFLADGFAAGLETMEVALLKRVGNDWVFDRIFPRHPGHTSNVNFGGVDTMLHGQWLLTMDGVPFEVSFTDPIRPYLHRRITTPDGSLAWHAPVALEIPADAIYCFDMQPVGERVVGQCYNTTLEAPEILIWDLTTINWTGASPLPATVSYTALPSPIGHPSYPWSAAEIERIDDFESVTFVFGGIGDDRIFANMRVQPTSLTYGVGHLVHFRRDTISGWVVEAPPSALVLGVPNQWTQTGVRITWPLSPTETIVGGDGNFADGSYGHWLARHDQATGTFTEVVRLDTLQFQGLYGITMQTPVIDALGRLYLAASTFAVDPTTSPYNTMSYNELPWRTFVVGPFFVADENPALTWLPLPPGTTALPNLGIRGPALGPAVRLSGHVRDADERISIVNWDFTRNSAGGFAPLLMEVMTTNEVLTTEAGGADHFDRMLRIGHEALSQYDFATPRCRQTFDEFESNISDFESDAVIFDPSNDNIDLDAVSFNDGTTFISSSGQIWPANVIIRAAAEEPESVWPLLDPGDSSLDLLNPAQPAEGNAWTATTRPAGIGLHIRQLASYHGEEALLCGGVSCNKVYWNTAIAFDPTWPDCELRFEATAANTASLINGMVPENSVWPFVIGRVPLTSPADEDGVAERMCGRHPLGSEEVATIYKPQGAELPLAWGYVPAGTTREMTDLFGPDVSDAERRTFYDDLEWLLNGGSIDDDDADAGP